MEQASKGISWIRYRLKTKSVSDWRPLVYDPRFPSWCSGYGGDEEAGTAFAVIIIYLPEGEPLSKYYDDAFDVTADDSDCIVFTDRFPKSKSFVEISPDGTSNVEVKPAGPLTAPALTEGVPGEKLSDIFYVAAPYSHSDPLVVESRFTYVSQYVAELTARGMVAISPVAYGHILLKYHEMPSDWAFWKNFCRSFLIKCRYMIVLQLEGWEKSEGIKGELEFARANGITIILVPAGSNGTDFVFPDNEK